MECIGCGHLSLYGGICCKCSESTVTHPETDTQESDH